MFRGVARWMCFLAVLALPSFLPLHAAPADLDESFSPEIPWQEGFSSISFLWLTQDGKILVNGPGLLRLNADGSRDVTFHPPANASAVVALSPEGGLWVKTQSPSFADSGLLRL